jgi:hypothetical protein
MLLDRISDIEHSNLSASGSIVVATGIKHISIHYTSHHKTGRARRSDYSRLQKAMTRDNSMANGQRRKYPLVALLLVFAATISPVGAEATSGSIVTLPSLTTNKERIGYVQQILSDRIDYLQNGKRKADFHQWVQERGGQAAIFSMHGVDVNFELDPEKGLDLQLEVFPLPKQRKNDPFLPDRMNLGLSNITTNSFYMGNVGNWDDRSPSSVQLLLRAVKLGIHFCPVVSTTWLALISKRFRRGFWYGWVATSLASSGAAFIKWGQWASTRSDMFPIRLCDELSLLHNAAPGHSWAYTQSLVESSLDIPLGSLLEVFASFDPEPLASGSIAQIHKARLKNGDLIAVKVRHPRVAQLMDMDFRLMAMVASVCDYIPALSWLHIRDTVSQFSHTMAAQAHLQVEAHHLEVLNHNFRSWDDVRFPQPFYASNSVIMETFEPGRIVTEILDLYESNAQSLDGQVEGHELIPIPMAKFLVSTGVALYLKMLLVDNLMVRRTRSDAYTLFSIIMLPFDFNLTHSFHSTPTYTLEI